jgi:hypothetical protein
MFRDGTLAFTILTGGLSLQQLHRYITSEFHYHRTRRSHVRSHYTTQALCRCWKLVSSIRISQGTHRDSISTDGCWQLFPGL